MTGVPRFDDLSDIGRAEKALQEHICRDKRRRAAFLGANETSASDIAAHSKPPQQLRSK